MIQSEHHYISFIFINKHLQYRNEPYAHINTVLSIYASGIIYGAEKALSRLCKYDSIPTGHQKCTKQIPDIKS